MFNECRSLFLIKTRLNFTSNFLTQNNPKSKYQCKNELICISFLSRSKHLQSCIIRLKNSWLRLEFLNLIIHSCSFFKQFTSNYEILKVEVREVFQNIDFSSHTVVAAWFWPKRKYHFLERIKACLLTSPHPGGMNMKRWLTASRKMRLSRRERSKYSDGVLLP